MDKATSIRVAIVDDNPILLAGVTAALSRTPDVTLLAAVSNAADLLAQEELDIDVVLLDLNILGEHYTKNIASLREQRPAAKLIAYTAYSDPEIVRETMRQGCSGYLPKKVHPEELIDALRTVHQGHSYLAKCIRVARGGARRARKQMEQAEPVRDEFQKAHAISKREKEILHHIARGLTSQQIAEVLFISRYTVETHRKNMLRKLNFSTSTELVRFAVRQELI